MFKLAATETYLTPVRVELPGDNNKPKVCAFKARFKRLSQTQFENVLERIGEGSLNDRGLLNEVLVGWEDVADDRDNAAEFNEENLNALLDMFPTQPTLVKTFLDSMKSAKQKN